MMYTKVKARIGKSNVMLQPQPKLLSFLDKLPTIEVEPPQVKDIDHEILRMSWRRTKSCWKKNINLSFGAC